MGAHISVPQIRHSGNFYGTETTVTTKLKDLPPVSSNKFFTPLISYSNIDKLFWRRLFLILT